MPFFSVPQKEQPASVGRLFFLAVNSNIHTDKPSSYLDYENSIYTADGFGLDGAAYYRLIDIAKDDQNIYTATFDTLSFAESELVDPEFSPNAHAVLDYAQTILHQNPKEISSSGSKFSSVIEAIFLQDDYAEILDMSGTITIQFALTGDPDNPFYYVSCTRENHSDL